MRTLPPAPLLALSTALVLSTPASARQACSTVRANVSAAGVEANSFTEYFSLAPDGRHISFSSHASNLVRPDSNGDNDIFLKDLATGAIEIVSRNSAGAQSNGRCLWNAVSNDARFVVFSSSASNLVATADSDIGSYDIFLRDRIAGTTIQLSTGLGGAPSLGPCEDVAISADGRRVAFVSYAANLVAGDVNGWRDIYVYDRESGVLTIESRSSAGAAANSESFRPTLSADGRWLAFSSTATNLVEPDLNGQSDLYVRDLETGSTTRIAALTASFAADWAPTASFSLDGRYMAFACPATLTPGETGVFDVFRFDRADGTLLRASVSSNGGAADFGSMGSSISGDGRFVVFASQASNLVAGDTNGLVDFFVRDCSAGTTRRLDLSPTGGESAGGDVRLFQSQPGLVSLDGTVAAYLSDASNLLAGNDANGTTDLFVTTCVAPEPRAYCVGSVNSQGCVLALTSSGTPSASAGSGFTLDASRLVNQRTAFVFYGLAGTGLETFGEGWLCVAGPWRRTPRVHTGGTALPALDCTGGSSFDFNAWIAAGVDASLIAGRTVSAQASARDPGLATARFGTTNAVRFVIGP